MTQLPRPFDDRKEKRPGFQDFRRKLGDEGELPPSRQPGQRGEHVEPKRVPSDRPNVLYIICDQLRVDTFGFMGLPSIRTPNLDRLATEGAYCTRSYCSSPVCMPARATFMTGHYVGRHNVVQNGWPMAKDEEVFPRRLSEAGYRTANIAKVHCGRGVNQIWEYHQGVKDAFGATKPSDVPFIRDVYPNLKFLGDHPCDNADSVLYGDYPGPVETTKSFNIANAAMKWLYYQDDPRPWFLRVSFDDPHPPVVPPEPYASMYKPEDVPPELLQGWKESLAGKPEVVRDFASYKQLDQTSEEDHRIHAAKYMGLVSHLDAQIGRILDYLDQTEFAESTIVVLNSDHGHMIGEHGLSHKGAFLFEGVLRIPTLLRWRGRIKPGTRIDALVDAVDFVPTIYDMLKLEIPEHLPGKSLVPLLTGQVEKIRDYAFAHWDDFGYCIVGERYKLCWWDTDEGELYDLESDPLEKQNLWDSPALSEVQVRMLAELQKWRDEHVM